MRPGITEADVRKAADALLLDGERPTIERVRLKIGRGSPNTVSPHLDAWFRQLGGRIRDPQAFGTSAQQQVPDAIATAAKHFWDTALETARQEAAAIADESRRQAEIAEEATRKATALLEAASREHERTAHDLATAQTTVSQLQQELAAQTARLDESRAAAVAAGKRLARQEAREADGLADLKRRLDAAMERADAVDRRAALEVDRERTLRGQAEQRAGALEARMEETRSAMASQLAEARERTAASEQRASHLLKDLHDATAALAVLRDELASARQSASLDAVALAAARAETAAAKRAFEALARSARALDRRRGSGHVGNRARRGPGAVADRE